MAPENPELQITETINLSKTKSFEKNCYMNYQATFEENTIGFEEFIDIWWKL